MELKTNEIVVVIHKNREFGNLKESIMGIFDSMQEANDLADELNLKYFLEIERNVNPKTDRGNQYVCYDLKTLMSQLSEKFNKE